MKEIISLLYIILSLIVIAILSIDIFFIPEDLYYIRIINTKGSMIFSIIWSIGIIYISYHSFTKRS